MRTLLVVNAGSSSIKFAVFDIAARATTRLNGQIDDIGGAARLMISGPGGQAIAEESLRGAGHTGALAHLLERLERMRVTDTLAAVGHRVVHGGRRLVDPVRIDDAALAELRSLIALAPLHQPHNIAAIETIGAMRPDLPQVACFDTAFHRTQPAVARACALPRALADEGIERYGFHGLSYESIADALPEHLGAAAEGRVIVAHLGNGASLCALRERRSVATTMGFSTLDGLVMGTRPGSIDPGILLHLLRNRGYTADTLADLLYHRSGLLGVSQISHDMRALLASTDPRASEAVELFVYRAAREIGSLAAALGGLDALVFTAGIGENSAPIRARICQACEWLGIALDDAKNARPEPRITRDDSRVGAWVIPTDEARVIAAHTMRVLRTGPSA